MRGVLPTSDGRLIVATSRDQKFQACNEILYLSVWRYFRFSGNRTSLMGAPRFAPALYTSSPWFSIVPVFFGSTEGVAAINAGYFL